MKKYFVTLLLLCTTYLSAATWVAGGVMNQGLSSGVLADVSLAYFPKIKKVVAAWANSTDNMPYYSTYDGIADTWSLAVPIPTTHPVLNNLNLQSFPFKQIVVAAWADNLTHLPYYSYFNGANWSPTQQISTGFTVQEEIKMTYDKNGHRLIAAWGDGSGPQRLPFYAFFHPNLTWSTPLQLDPTFGVHTNINLVYHKGLNTVIAAWGYYNPLNPNGTYLAYYSFFSGGVWTTNQFPASGVTNGVFDEIRMVYDATFDAVAASWGNFGVPPYVMPNQYRAPIFSYLLSGVWTTPAIANNPSSHGVTDNISGGVVIDTGVAVGAWGDSHTAPATGKPMFSDTTSAHGIIPFDGSDGVHFNVNMAYDQNSKKLVAAWGNYDSMVPPGTPTPYYSLYE